MGLATRTHHCPWMRSEEANPREQKKKRKEKKKRHKKDQKEKGKRDFSAGTSREKGVSSRLIPTHLSKKQGGRVADGYSFLHHLLTDERETVERNGTGN
ncbi:hypothetical protein QR685DRAFT_337182 [Neurospora intermedia]|uniref:Uncharacterized protein n=1 Tax=Neurospora intermedia TaxID=5142 RepID=A0ABR3D6K5_NEUIN